MLVELLHSPSRGYPMSDQATLMQERLTQP